MFLGGREGGLQAVRGVGGIVHAGALLPLARRLFRDAIALRQRDYAVSAGRYLRANGRGGACVLVQRDHHEKAPGARIERPSRSSTNWRIASRAASNGYLLGSMQSSGMRHVDVHEFVGCTELVEVKEIDAVAVTIDQDDLHLQGQCCAQSKNEPRSAK